MGAKLSPYNVMSEKSFNPFKQNKEVLEMVPALANQLDTFKQQVRNHTEFANPHVPQEIKDLFLGSLEMQDPEGISLSIQENAHGVYSGKTIEDSFRTWMKIHFIGEEVYNLKQAISSNEKFGIGEKLMFSNLIDDIEGLLISSGEET